MHIHRWLKGILLGILIVLPGVCHAQWYQGPSGGRVGSPFDFWTLSEKARDMRRVKLWIRDHSISCIQVSYRDGLSRAAPTAVPLEMTLPIPQQGSF